MRHTRTTAGLFAFLLIAMLWLHPALAADDASGAPVSADKPVDFERDVRPILNARCVKCHGSQKQEGGLRLDRRMYAAVGGDSHKPILLGTLATNELYLRITSDDPDVVMPKEGRRLDDNQKDIIRRWVQQGTPWPDEEGGPPPRWEMEVEKFVARYDRYFRPIFGYVVATLGLILLMERSRLALQRGNRWSRGWRGRVVRVLARIPRSTGLVILLTIFLVHAHVMARNLRQETARLLARPPSSEGLSIRTIYGSPPVPFRPAQPPRLGGEYYRGNCERNDELFNRGNYRTATMRLSLHDGRGNRLQAGDAVPASGLKLRYEIERAPQAEPSLFSAKIMDHVFLSDEYYESRLVEPLDAPVWLEPVEGGERWAAFYPIAGSREIRDGELSGLVYVFKGRREGTQIGGECHYAIKYDLLIRDGVIAEGSDMWVGSIFWHSGIALPADSRKVPFEEWFSSEPIPVITGPNSRDPRLLGVEEHLPAAP